MNIGIYVHIPFCRIRCSYCHFVTRRWKESVAERYLRAVLREIEAFVAGNSAPSTVDTIYFGGGTPSEVPAEHIEAILGTCCRLFDVSPGCETTLEANPGSISAEKAELYRRMGVNRISLGAQSFDDQELVSIGRDHRASQIEESLALLRAGGIWNLNLDLMLGIPGQSQGSWTVSLGRVAELRPTHLSIYMLDLDDKMPLYHEVAKGRCRLPDEDSVSDFYLQTLDHLAACGYEQYEISNFALAGCQSRHNLKYWRCRPVIGFGVGSHSFDGRSRYANYSNMSAYLKSIEARESCVEWREAIGRVQGLQETLFLGLRLNQGLDWKRVTREYGASGLEDYEAALEELAEQGLLRREESTFRLTSRGMLLSNEVFQRFV